MGVVVDEQPNPSVIDFLKCGQRLHAIKRYQSIFPNKSLPECRDDVGIISSDLFGFPMESMASLKMVRRSIYGL